MIEKPTKEEMREALDDIKEMYPAVRKYKLRRPVTVAENTYTELDIDFDSLSENDFNSISKMSGCAVTTDSNGIPVFTDLFCKHIITRAAKISLVEFGELTMADGMALKQMARGFLLGTALEASAATTGK